MLRAISPTEAASCSALSATDWTLLDVLVAANDAEPASDLARAMAPLISVKFSSINDFRSDSRLICAVISTTFGGRLTAPAIASTSPRTT